MGVRIPDNDFAAFGILRDLETARNDISSKNDNVKTSASTLFIENNTGEATPLSLDWVETSDNEEPFNVMDSRNCKSARKKICGGYFEA
jgi:hypothetical protein